MRFLNRSDELALLGRRLEGQQAELLVIYGRRRIGKTELLGHLAGSTRSLYFEATDSVALDQLRDLTAELAWATGDPVLLEQPLTTWQAALAAIAAFASGERTLVVFDEFQLLAQESRELATTLSRWWRTTGRRLPLTLVLAGSEVSFFEDTVLAGQLYGRRTGQLKLTPFLARDAALFHPRYSAEDKVRAYSVCGGVPYYLERFSDDQALARHLLDEILDRTGLLHEEAELMLRQSLADPTNHIAVLRSIAAGHNQVNTISQRTKIAASSVVKVLGVLERLGLVDRIEPVTSIRRSKKTAYFISDHFLRFHYRFVEPAKSRLRTSELARRYLKDAVLPKLDLHTSRAWEEVCQQHVQRVVPELSKVGRWWGPVPTGEGRRTELREVDVVGVDADRTPVLVGMCKWTTTKVAFDELNLLDRLVPHIGGDPATIQRYLFSRKGFAKRLEAHAADDPNLHLVTPTDIYA